MRITHYDFTRKLHDAIQKTARHGFINKSVKNITVNNSIVRCVHCNTLSYITFQVLFVLFNYVHLGTDWCECFSLRSPGAHMNSLTVYVFVAYSISGSQRCGLGKDSSR